MGSLNAALSPLVHAHLFIILSISDARARHRASAHCSNNQNYYPALSHWLTQIPIGAIGMQITFFFHPGICQAFFPGRVIAM